MELRPLRYLIAVAEHGNFTRAAEALHVSQPALSRQILQMEERLGAALLDRSGRTVTVTDAGLAYIAHVRRALSELESGRRAIHDVRDLSRGRVRLAMTPTFTAYLAGPLVGAFHARYPGITVTVREMSMASVAFAVEADEVDLGIAFALARATDIEFLPVFAERLSIVVAAGHAWAERRSIEVRALADAGLGLLSTDFVTRAHIDAYLREHGLAPKVAVEANTIGALVEIVRHSELATILPEAIARNLPGLRNLTLKPSPAPRTVMILRRKDAYQSAAARACIDMIMVEAAKWRDQGEAALMFGA